MSSANPIYETLKYLDEDDIIMIMDDTDKKIFQKLDEIEKEKEDIKDYNKYIEAWKIYIYKLMRTYIYFYLMSY
jgi:hypothetical protein